MNIMNQIEQYILDQKIGNPIYTNDIYNFVNKSFPNVDKSLFNLYLNRYEKRNKYFQRYQKGIYYKIIETPFGYSNINHKELIKREYLSNNEEVYGYETGPSFMNSLGLTTLIPKYKYITSNNIKHTTKDEEQYIYYIKPITIINKENYRYLQFLDILENKFNIEFDNNDYQYLLLQYIKKYNLNYKKLFSLALLYHNINVYERLSILIGE